MDIFGDEGGYTGNQLLDGQQDVFTYATIALPREKAEELVKRLIRDYRLQGDELKGRNLVKRPTGYKVVKEVLRTLEGKFTVAVNHKAFALCCKFFEYVFEPTFSDVNSFFYHNNFHLYIGSVLYVYMLTRNADAEQLLQAFSVYARTGEAGQFRGFLPVVMNEEPDDPLTAIGLFARLHRDTISDEMGRIHDGQPSWILDLTRTSVYHQLTRWSERYGELTVTCDDSKPLRLVKRLFDAMVGKSDQVYVEFQDEHHPYTFHLTEPIQLVDSKTSSGVQLADVVASAAASAYSHLNRAGLLPQDEEWLSMLEGNLIRPIWPEPERFTPQTKDGLTGMLLLTELVRRSMQGTSLIDGLPQLLHVALNDPTLRTAMRPD